MKLDRVLRISVRPKILGFDHKILSADVFPEFRRAGLVDVQLVIHGSIASRAMKSRGGGLACCVTITHLDGIVLARSAFHSSMNYRCVMVFGTARPVEGESLKPALDILVEHLAPGRLRTPRGRTRMRGRPTALRRTRRAAGARNQ